MLTSTLSGAARRRWAALIALALAAAFTLTACGSSNATDAKSTSSSGVSDAAFPVTVDGAYGKVTISKKPERIVALGGSAWSDFLSFTDVRPVAFSSYGSTAPDAKSLFDDYPWLKDAEIGTYDPSLVTSSWKPSPENIAKYKPDLILTTHFQTDEKMYQQLSQIAPTFAGVSADTVDDWRTTGDALGRLTGTTDAIDAAMKKVDDAYAAARKRLPGVQGKTYQFGTFDGKQFMFGNGAWLEGFGLKPAANQIEGQHSGDVSQVSLENLDQMNADVLSLYIWESKNEKILKSDPRYASLPAAKNDAVHIFGNVFGNASNTAGPLSLLWIIDQVTPFLADSALNKAGQ